MFKNRFVLILAALSMLLVTLAVSQPFSKPPKTVDLSLPARPVIVPVTGVEERPYSMDSATRSYIAWGEALEAAGKLGASGTCPTTSRENIFGGIPNNLNSGTRSYVAWGLALRAKDDLCR